MAKTRKELGGCDDCEQGVLTCSHNVFVDEAEELRIDSWEHRCSECGYRETEAIRSDDEDRESDEPGTLCPFCGRSDP